MSVTAPENSLPEPPAVPLVPPPKAFFPSLASRGVAVLIAAVAVALVLAYGFRSPFLSPRVVEIVELVLIAAFVMERIGSLLVGPQADEAFRRGWLDYAVIAAGVTLVVIDFHAYRDPVRQAVVVYVLLQTAARAARHGLLLCCARMGFPTGGTRPGVVIALSFIVVIVLGAFLLTLPVATNPSLAGQTPYQWRAHALNCFFTATSAVSLTGLTVYQTGHDFTFVGRVILLVLIQAGGLAVLSMGAVFAMLAGRWIDATRSGGASRAWPEETAGEITRTLTWVIACTFVIEGIGAVVLYPAWTEQDAADGGRWFWSVFHAVSAFCNAGFGLRDDSFVTYRGCRQVYGAILGLIVLGGLGLPVLREVVTRPFAWRRGRGGEVVCSLHTKLALATTAVLILVGTVLLWVSETPAKSTKRYEIRLGEQVMVKHYPDRMRSMTTRERWAAALFLSVSARTGGFSPALTDEESLWPATHALLCLLMFVGGSPASTAGGIRTVTFAVLLLAVWAALRGRERPSAFGRTIPAAAVRGGLALAGLMAALVLVVTWLLCYIEPHSFGALLLETVSATSNAGLSTGITPTLTKAGRLLLIACMFVGRLLPPLLLVSLAGQARSSLPTPPEEDLIVG